MARAGTLPNFIFYQREIAPGESFRCCREIFIVLMMKTGMRHVAYMHVQTTELELEL